MSFSIAVLYKSIKDDVLRLFLDHSLLQNWPKDLAKTAERPPKNPQVEQELGKATAANSQKTIEETDTVYHDIS